MERAKQAVQAAVSDAQVTGGIAGAAVGALVGQAVAPGPLGAVVGKGPCRTPPNALRCAAVGSLPAWPGPVWYMRSGIEAALTAPPPTLREAWQGCALGMGRSACLRSAAAVRRCSGDDASRSNNSSARVLPTLPVAAGAAAFGQGMAALGRTVMDPRSIREGHGMPTVVMREAEVMADRAEPGADEPPEATEATEAAAGGQAGLGPDAHTASPRPAS